MQDPNMRLDVQGALRHPWVNGNNTAPLPIISRVSKSGCSEPI